MRKLFFRGGVWEIGNIFLWNLVFRVCVWVLNSKVFDFYKYYVFLLILLNIYYKFVKIFVLFCFNDCFIGMKYFKDIFDFFEYFSVFIVC